MCSSDLDQEITGMDAGISVKPAQDARFSCAGETDQEITGMDAGISVKLPWLVHRAVDGLEGFLHVLRLFLVGPQRIDQAAGVSV